MCVVSCHHRIWYLDSFSLFPSAVFCPSRPGEGGRSRLFENQPHLFHFPFMHHRDQGLKRANKALSTSNLPLSFPLLPCPSPSICWLVGFGLHSYAHSKDKQVSRQRCTHLHRPPCPLCARHDLPVTLPFFYLPISPGFFIMSINHACLTCPSWRVISRLRLNNVEINFMR